MLEPLFRMRKCGKESAMKVRIQPLFAFPVAGVCLPYIQTQAVIGQRKEGSRTTISIQDLRKDS